MVLLAEAEEIIRSPSGERRAEMVRAFAAKQAEPEQETGQAGPKLTAEGSYDMWGFGVMVYKLCSSGGHFFSENGAGDRDGCADQVPHHWYADKVRVTGDIKWPWARDLALWCLQDKPERRPKSFEEVLEHPFLDTRLNLPKPSRSGAFSQSDLLQEGLRYEGTSEQRAVKFHRAVQKNDIITAKQMLEAGGVDVSSVLAGQESRVTPLHRAARQGNLEMLQLLIEEGAYVNAQTQFGYTALHWAARDGKAEIVEELLSNPKNHVQALGLALLNRAPGLVHEDV